MFENALWRRGIYRQVRYPGMIRGNSPSQTDVTPHEVSQARIYKNDSTTIGQEKVSTEKRATSEE